MLYKGEGMGGEIKKKLLLENEWGNDGGVMGGRKCEVIEIQMFRLEREMGGMD